jgi:hypothetical protein
VDHRVRRRAGAGGLRQRAVHQVRRAPRRRREEAKAAGQPAAEDKRAELVEKTVEACNAEPPKQDVLECALKADSTKAMKLCEGVDEDAKKKE